MLVYSIQSLVSCRLYEWTEAVVIGYGCSWRFQRTPQTLNAFPDQFQSRHLQPGPRGCPEPTILGFLSSGKSGPAKRLGGDRLTSGVAVITHSAFLFTLRHHHHPLSPPLSAIASRHTPPSHCPTSSECFLARSRRFQSLCRRLVVSVDRTRELWPLGTSLQIVHEARIG